MASAVKAAFGSILKKGASEVAELKSITVGGMRLDTIDITNHQSPSGAEEVIAGILRTGEFSCEGNFLNTGAQATLITDHQAKTPASWTVVLGTTPTATIVATCLVTALDFTAKFDEALAFSATLKVSTGMAVFTP